MTALASEPGRSCKKRYGEQLVTDTVCCRGGPCLLMTAPTVST